jgi:hypothetical protein
MPSWASRITRHFWATRCGVVPERTNDSSCALAASSTARAVAVGNRARLNHGQPILSIVMWDGTLGVFTNASTKPRIYRLPRSLSKNKLAVWGEAIL